MIEEILERFILPRLRFKVIAGDCVEQRGPLMTRWMLYKGKSFNVCIHRFHRSDMDRAFHDHPWHFCAVLLTGGYREHTPQGSFWRRRFSVLLRPAYISALGGDCKSRLHASDSNE